MNEDDALRFYECYDENHTHLPHRHYPDENGQFEQGDDTTVWVRVASRANNEI